METEIRPKRVCSPKYAVQKAKKGKALNKWELEELAKDPELSLKYAKITKRRFPEGEPEIALRPELALDYARNVIGGPFPEAENALLRKMENTYVGSSFVRQYFIANEIRNERVEKYILERECGVINEYAKMCVKGRWPEAENKLLQDRLEHAVDYQNEVIGGRWEELEDRILFGKGLSYWDSPLACFKNYLKNIGGRIPEIESKLEKSKKASFLLAYAVLSMKGRLPQTLHQKMMMFAFDPKRQKSAKKYLKFLQSMEDKVLGYLRGLDEDERQELLAKARTN